MTLPRSRYHGSCIDQFLSNDVYAEVQTFDGSDSEQCHVSRLRENDIVGCRKSGRMDDSVPHFPFDAASVSQHESLTPLHLDAKGFEDFTGNPGELASRIHHCVRQLVNRPVLRNVFHADSRAQNSHSFHYEIPGSGLLNLYTLIITEAMHERGSLPQRRANTSPGSTW
ncbi:MAG TPA: hypothetical protein VK494_04715 [Gemmatimonadaceae bacterium]|nr:hypothetical protein [Gemmatimonadaceae bacterium]